MYRYSIERNMNTITHTTRQQDEFDKMSEQQLHMCETTQLVDYIGDLQNDTTGMADEIDRLQKKEVEWEASSNKMADRIAELKEGQLAQDNHFLKQQIKDLQVNEKVREEKLQDLLLANKKAEEYLCSSTKLIESNTKKTKEEYKELADECVKLHNDYGEFKNEVCKEIGMEYTGAEYENIDILRELCEMKAIYDEAE